MPRSSSCRPQVAASSSRRRRLVRDAAFAFDRCSVGFGETAFSCRQGAASSRSPRPLGNAPLPSQQPPAEIGGDMSSPAKPAGETLEDAPPQPPLPLPLPKAEAATASASPAQWPQSRPPGEAVPPPISMGTGCGRGLKGPAPLAAATARSCLLPSREAAWPPPSPLPLLLMLQAWPLPKPCPPLPWPVTDAEEPLPQEDRGSRGGSAAACCACAGASLLLHLRPCQRSSSSLCEWCSWQRLQQ